MFKQGQCKIITNIKDCVFLRLPQNPKSRERLPSVFLPVPAHFSYYSDLSKNRGILKFSFKLGIRDQVFCGFMIPFKRRKEQFASANNFQTQYDHINEEQVFVSSYWSLKANNPYAVLLPSLLRRVLKWDLTVGISDWMRRKGKARHEKSFSFLALFLAGIWMLRDM